MTIDLTGNLFHCHCHDNHTSTIHWLRHTDVTIVNFASMLCIGHDGEELIWEKDLDRYRDACSILDEIVTAVAVSVASTLACVGLVVLWRQLHKHRYKLRTRYHKLRLAARGLREEEHSRYDVFFCYVHSDDEAMEEVRAFLEGESGLKCCIPQRDFDYEDGDTSTATEKHLNVSAATLVLWSCAALESETHEMQYRMARNMELYRRFHHRVLHVCVEDLSDVTDADVKSILRCGQYMQWKCDWTEAQKQRFMERLLGKIYRRIAMK